MSLKALLTSYNLILLAQEHHHSHFQHNIQHLCDPGRWWDPKQLVVTLNQSHMSGGLFDNPSSVASQTPWIICSWDLLRTRSDVCPKTSTNLVFFLHIDRMRIIFPFSCWLNSNTNYLQSFTGTNTRIIWIIPNTNMEDNGKVQLQSPWNDIDIY